MFKAASRGQECNIAIAETTALFGLNYSKTEEKPLIAILDHDLSRIESQLRTAVGHFFAEIAKEKTDDSSLATKKLFRKSVDNYTEDLLGI